MQKHEIGKFGDKSLNRRNKEFHEYLHEIDTVENGVCVWVCVRWKVPSLEYVPVIWH